MLQKILLIVIIVLAVAYVTWALYRKLTHKGDYHCVCGKHHQCEHCSHRPLQADGNPEKCPFQEY